MFAIRWRKRCLTSVRKNDWDELNTLFENSSHMHDTFQWRFELQELFDDVLAFGLSGPNPQSAAFLECMKSVAEKYFSVHKRSEDLGILALCVLEQRVDELEILVEAGIPLTCRGRLDMERSPLHILALSENTLSSMRNRPHSMPDLEAYHIEGHARLRMAEALLQHGLSPDIQCQNGCTALHLSVIFNSVKMLKLLLSWGGDMEVKNVEGQSVLMMAATEGSAQSLEFLLYAGADPNVRNTHGFTPISMAVKYNHLNVVRLLLQFNCSTDDRLVLTQSLYGSSEALVSYAAELGHSEICQLLLLAGCENTLLKFNLTDEHFRNKIISTSNTGVFPEWLDRYCYDSIPTLKVMSRAVIRKILGNKFVSNYLFLPLPDLMLDYLTIPEIRLDKSNGLL